MTECVHIELASQTPPTEDDVDANAAVSADDRDWFAAHPGRKYRLRLMTTVEYKRTPIDDLRATDTAAILVHQVAPGLRKRFNVIITCSVLDPRWAAYFGADDHMLEPMYQELEATSSDTERRLCAELGKLYQSE